MYIKANIEETKEAHIIEKNNNLVGRNINNKNTQKTFSNDNLHHKKNINNSVDDKNLNNKKIKGIPSENKLKKSVTNIGSKEIHKDNIPSQKKKDKLIKISEYKIEQSLQNKNENKYTLNNI